MKHIVLVEDDLKLAALIEKFLGQNGFKVSVLNSGYQAPEKILALCPDLVILDIMLPKMDGFTICKNLRRYYNNPIIFLTAKDSDFDHVLGLEIGADDYIIKPVVPHVLLAHINVVLRRATADKPKEADSITYGELTVERTARKVYHRQQLLDLTTHEFDLLWLLASNAGEPLSRDYIHKKMIGREYDGLDRSVDVRVSRLRKKLDDDTANPYKIITVWGKGYQFSTTAWDIESDKEPA